MTDHASSKKWALSSLDAMIRETVFDIDFMLIYSGQFAAICAMLMWLAHIIRMFPNKAGLL